MTRGAWAPTGRCLSAMWSGATHVAAALVKPGDLNFGGLGDDGYPKRGRHIAGPEQRLPGASLAVGVHEPPARRRAAGQHRGCRSRRAARPRAGGDRWSTACRSASSRSTMAARHRGTGSRTQLPAPLCVPRRTRRRSPDAGGGTPTPDLRIMIPSATPAARQRCCVSRCPRATNHGGLFGEIVMARRSLRPSHTAQHQGSSRGDVRTAVVRAAPPRPGGQPLRTRRNLPAQEA
jgi:hypothetical protein